MYQMNPSCQKVSATLSEVQDVRNFLSDVFVGVKLNVYSMQYVQLEF